VRALDEQDECEENESEECVERFHFFLLSVFFWIQFFFCFEFTKWRGLSLIIGKKNNSKNNKNKQRAILYNLYYAVFVIKL
jgi:hypothetical protein